MIFDYIEIENFFRIREKVKIHLNNQGLVLITGLNGDGKSTIFEALIWCLWGRTVRGYKADQVVNRDVGEGCSVTTVMSDGVVAYRVVRYRKHSTGKNKLTLVSYDFMGSGSEVDLTQQTNDDTQTKLNEILGIDFDTFTNGPMMPQGSFKRFSEMADAEIKSVLEKAVQVSVIAKAQEKAKQQLAAAETKLHAVALDFNSHSRSLDSEESEMIDLQKLHDEFDVKKATNLKWIEDDLSALDDRMSKFKTLIETVELQYQLTLAQAAHQQISKMYDESRKEWEKKIDEARVAESQASSQHMMMSKECEHLQDAKKKIKNLSGVCPSCEQTILPSHVEKLLAETDERWQVANTYLKTRLAPMVLEAQKTEQQLKLDRDKALERAKEIWLTSIEHLHDLEKKVEVDAGIVREMKQLEADITKAKDRLDLAKSEVSPFADLIQKNLEAQAEITKHMQRILPRMRSLGMEVQHIEFWVAAFSNRGLKSFILESVVPFMNDKAREYSTVLTDGELEIQFHTQTTLKSGEVREKFYVEVFNKAGAEDYTGSSGGERRRADLAISFTLSDLVSARSKKSFPQRFFDEPLESLDEEGVESVMQLLRDMTAKSGSVFVITHQEHLKSMFDKVIEVEKIQGVTRIKQ